MVKKPAGRPLWDSSSADTTPVRNLKSERNVKMNADREIKKSNRTAKSKPAKQRIVKGTKTVRISGSKSEGKPGRKAIGSKVGSKPGYRSGSRPRNKPQSQARSRSQNQPRSKTKAKVRSSKPKVSEDRSNRSTRRGPDSARDKATPNQDAATKKKPLLKRMFGLGREKENEEKELKDQKKLRSKVKIVPGSSSKTDESKEKSLTPEVLASIEYRRAHRYVLEAKRILHQAMQFMSVDQSEFKNQTIKAHAYANEARQLVAEMNAKGDNANSNAEPQSPKPSSKPMLRSRSNSTVSSGVTDRLNREEFERRLQSKTMYGLDKISWDSILNALLTCNDTGTTAVLAHETYHTLNALSKDLNLKQSGNGTEQESRQTVPQDLSCSNLKADGLTVQCRETGKEEERRKKSDSRAVEARGKKSDDLPCQRRETEKNEERTKKSTRSTVEQAETESEERGASTQSDDSPTDTTPHLFANFFKRRETEKKEDQKKKSDTLEGEKEERKKKTVVLAIQRREHEKKEENKNKVIQRREYENKEENKNKAIQRREHEKKEENINKAIQRREEEKKEENINKSEGLALQREETENAERGVSKQSDDRDAETSQQGFTSFFSGLFATDVATSDQVKETSTSSSLVEESKNTASKPVEITRNATSNYVEETGGASSNPVQGAMDSWFRGVMGFGLEDIDDNIAVTSMDSMSTSLTQSDDDCGTSFGSDTSEQSSDSEDLSLDPSSSCDNDSYFVTGNILEV